MSWITILWSMNAAACLTLAAIYLLVWSKHREDWVHLLFSFTAISVAVIAGFELAVMRSETPEQFGTLMRWAHVPIWALIVSLVWFVRFRLRAGRMWLAWSVCALRSLALFLNFLFLPNLNYRQITSLQQVDISADGRRAGAVLAMVRKRISLSRTGVRARLQRRQSWEESIPWLSLERQ